MNWAAIRAKCTNPVWFGLPREQVKSDVAIFNREGHPISLKELCDTKCMVIYIPDPAPSSHKNVVFEMCKHGPITAHRNTKKEQNLPVFEANVRFFEEDKSCHLMIDGRRIALWQASWMALDPLVA